MNEIIERIDDVITEGKTAIVSIEEYNPEIREHYIDKGFCFETHYFGGKIVEYAVSG